MAPHSSTLAWKIPQMEEPGRLQSMGSLGVGHNWATSLSLFTFMHWRRKWQPTPVFLPRESQGRGSLVGCRLWGRTESVGHDWSNLAAAARIIGGRHDQPTPVFLPGESHGQRCMGRLQSIGSQRIERDWNDLALTDELYTFVGPRGEVGSFETSTLVSVSAQKMRGPQRQGQGSKNKDLLSLDHRSQG